jgi:hypothetical protein
MMHTNLNPKHNDWYEELCALGAVGELSAPEFEDLKEHLRGCAACRILYEDFRRLASEDLGTVAILKQKEHPADCLHDVPERELLSRVLDRASRERISTPPAGYTEMATPKRGALLDRVSGVMSWLRQPALSYGSLALILCVVAAIGAYRLRQAQLAPTLHGLTFEVAKWKNEAKTSESERKSSADLLEREKSERVNFQKALTEAQTKYVDLEAQEKSLELQLADALAGNQQKDQDLATARSDEDGRNKQIVELQGRLDAAVARTEEQRRVADSLQVRLNSAEQALTATPEAQGFNDADAKELFGARDLHIVDVYDVNSSGQTQRTYGRVYYVEKKLLIFYAFDLQDKKHNRAAAGFQAWGYREANEAKPESLGLFTLDDASLNRWVLQVNNPRVLERIDAVYVTLEPPNGSPSPRGRRLLYANLVVPPNHP